MSKVKSNEKDSFAKLYNTDIYSPNNWRCSHFDKTLNCWYKRFVIFGISRWKCATTKNLPLPAAACHTTHDHRLWVTCMRERCAAQIFGFVRRLEELQTRLRIMCNCRRIPGTQRKEKVCNWRRQLFEAHFNSVMPFTVYVIHYVAGMPNWIIWEWAMTIVDRICVNFPFKYKTGSIQVVTSMYRISPEQIENDMVEVWRNCVQ